MSSEDKKDKAGSTASLKNRFIAEKPEEELVDEFANEQRLTHESYDELLDKLNKAEAEADQQREKALRTQAEMQNMRRRAELDIASAHKFGLEKFVNELLPIIDSLERAIDTHTDEDSGEGSLLGGVNLTLKMFATAMEKFGVDQINPVGEAFNPELHQAVSTQVDPKVKPGTVISVLQKGYLLNKRLIRPALVIVAKAGS